MNKPKNSNQTVIVKSTEENPEPLELIAKAIIQVADAFKKIEAGPLKRKTVVLLLQDQTSLSQKAINSILDVAPKLADHYVKFLPKSTK